MFISIATDNIEHFKATHKYVCGAIALSLGPKIKLLNTYPSFGFSEVGAEVEALGDNDLYRLATFAEACGRLPC